MPLSTPDRFPGPARWFALRFELAQQREAAQLDELAQATPGTAVDIPLAGTDWPIAPPVRVQSVVALANEHRVAQRHYRLITMADEHGITLRVRAFAEHRTHAFAAALARTCHEARERIRTINPQPPFEALHACRSNRLAPARWRSAFLPREVLPHPDPNDAAIVLASFASVLAKDLPRYARANHKSEPDLDLLLPPTLHNRSGAARSALDQLAQRLRTIPGPPVPGLICEYDGWRIIGFRRHRDETLRAALTEEIETMSAQLDDTSGPTHVLCETTQSRIGLNAFATLSRFPPHSSAEEIALGFAAEHGLSCGDDLRMRDFARRCSKAPGAIGLDVLLALDRLASIPNDPCHTKKLRSTMRRLLHARSAS